MQESARTSLEHVDFGCQQTKDPALRRLLTLAAEALYDEDDALYAAFSASPSSAFGPARNHGLAYWLFETTLVYFVFKRWLLAGFGAEWEYPYLGDRQAKADLITVDTQNAPDRLFEVKWWNRDDAKTNQRVIDDVRKLLSWDGTIHRYLITFWTENIEDFNRPLEDERHLERCQKLVGSEIVHASRFPTAIWCPQQKKEVDTGFVIATFRINPTAADGSNG